MDCKQFLFSLKIRGDECKTTERARVAIELDERAANGELGLPTTTQLATRGIATSTSRPDAYLFCVLPHRFREKKRDCSQSIDSLWICVACSIHIVVPDSSVISFWLHTTSF